MTTKKKGGKAAQPAPALVPVVPAPLPNTGYCPNGHLIWSGGPPSDGEFPLTCRFCEVLVERPK